MKPRTIFIGDVHGCYTELLELLAKVELTEQDELVFVGDLIHKGPRSADVVDLIIDYSARGYNINLMLGNHEEKHLRWIRHEKTRLRTGKKNPTNHTEEYPATNIDDKRANFFRSHGWIAKKYGQYLVVHGGIPSNMPSLQDFTYEDWREMSSKDKKHFGQVLRCRFVNPKGKMVSLGQQTDADKFWAEEYDGRFGTVIFGHNPFMQESPKTYPHAVGLDLGCVHGGNLCAFVVTEKLDPTFVIVKAKRIYKPRLSIYDRK